MDTTKITSTPTVGTVIGTALAERGLRQAFGVTGSGNFAVTRALVDAGATFVSARHEAGAMGMADGWSRTTGTTSIVSVHQGPGFTNLLTPLVEATKSRTGILVLAATTPPTRRTSNFWLDQKAVAEAAGATVLLVDDAERATATALNAARLAASRTVVLLLDTDVLDQPAPATPTAVPRPGHDTPAAPEASGVAALLDLLEAADRPVFVAGRGARDASPLLVELAERHGALLATSAVARGLFAGDPWNLDVCGGFATDAAARLVQGADLVVAWGASLNRWTTRSGSLLRDARVVQVDRDATLIGEHEVVDLGVVGDVGVTARQLLDAGGEARRGYRTSEVHEQIATGTDWRNVPYDDAGTETTIDPRTFTIGVDALLPAARVVVPDGGNFNGYPAMFLGVDDADSYCLPLAFQSIALALATGVGVALAHPERLVVVGVGDGGFMMAPTELDTAVRHGLGLLVLVYDDHAYGAEVHHFGPTGAATDIAEFPDTDLAAVARGYGCEAVTVRSTADLGPVAEWIAGPRERPLVVDAKIASFPSWVLTHTFSAE
ncbi:MAG: thiamine pyrophosphate-binding protein [Actinomycetales bacterium]|nr:MAG: thiamine pyrophosphate-binding protein [Actinomycetales bacterium]